MKAIFYIKHQKKLKEIHRQDVPDGTSTFNLKGVIQVFPNGLPPQTITQDLKFVRIYAEHLDYGMFLCDADMEMQRFDGEVV